MRMARSKKERKIKIGARGKKKRKSIRFNRKLAKEHKQAKRLMQALDQVNDISDNRELKKVLRNYNVRISDTIEKKIRTLQEFNLQGRKAHNFVEKYVRKGWDRGKARSLYYLVTDDIYSIFRQKYHMPSDIYIQLIDEDFTEEEILRAMDKLNNADDAFLGDLKPQEIYDLLKGILQS